MRIRPTYIPPSHHPKPEGAPAGDAGTVVLEDGTRLVLREAGAYPGATQRFFEALSDAERTEVERSLGVSDEAPSSDADPSEPPWIDPAEGGAYLALDRGMGDAATPRGWAAYRSLPLADGDAPTEARVTLAVDPDLRQRGLGTLLLDRLMVLAARKGVERLVGLAHRDNQGLIELFRRGGFEAREQAAPDGFLQLHFATRSGPLGTPSRPGRRARAAASLHPLFHPRSVAVIGASRQPESVGYRILDSLVRAGFDGPVYPINPNAQHVGSIRAYPSLAAVDAPVDLAVLAVPAALVPRLVDECVAAGVRALVVITAGFAEIGGDGADIQRQITETVRAGGLRMVGPNCLGVVHTHPDVRLNASFAPHMPPPGSVALCSQSGALGIAIIALARRLGLGLSSFVSVGNKADVSGNDLLEYWEDDEATRVVLFYLESFGNPQRFARIARRVGRSKPVVVVKAGRTGAGRRAASSHTAALMAADTAVDALFRQTGILRADTLEEMFGIARALVEQPLPAGRRTAIVTNAGGPGILCADALEAAGLSVEPLREVTRDAIRTFLPREASVTNPVDLIASASPESYQQAVEAVLRAEEVDALVVIYTPTGIHPVAEISAAITDAVARVRATDRHEKPVYASIVGDDEPAWSLCCADGSTIPVFPFPEEIGRTLGKIAAYADWRRADPGLFLEPADQDLDRARELCRQALAEPATEGARDTPHGESPTQHGADGTRWLGGAETAEVLRAAGLPQVRGGFARTVDEAVALAEVAGFPVAVKLSSRTLVHKTEVGGVILDLADADAVRDAVATIQERLAAVDEADAFDGVIVQEMVDGAVEVMLGVDQDPLFGPLVAFGLGGIHVEILRDVAFRVAPLTDRDAREMVHEIRGFPLLEGYRGHAAADVPALEDALLRLSRLAEAVPEIASLDLNPVFALEPGEGYRVADARIAVRPPSEPKAI